jgi:ADP-heptose:LPS heptosyltransferase
VQDFGFRHWGDRGTEAIRTAFRGWYREGDFDLVLDPTHAVSGAGEVLWEPPLPQIRDAGQPLQAEALRGGADGMEAVRYAVERGWGLAMPRSSPRIHVSADAHCFARVFLATQGKEACFAALSTAASSPLKRWRLENFIEAGRWLVAKGFHVVIFTGPEEELVADHIASALPAGSAVIASALHLERVAGVLSRCQLLLCNDTGLMCVAAAVGCTPIAVFGPTSPTIYAPGNGVAVGGREPACFYRRTMEFGPPECVAGGACRHEEGPCIDHVALDTVIGTLARVIGDKE